MRCLIHIGTEKTGTSYLQCKMALARKELLENGLWFAKGADFDEKCMRTGLISGGNALKLAEEVEQDAWSRVLGRLRDCAQEGKRLKATSVVISSELLLRPLSINGRLARFTDTLKQAGFSEPSFILVLRDPVAQLLSLYKHRAKNGTSGNLMQWCQTGYQLPQELAGILDQADQSDTTLLVRRYCRSSGNLDRMFFTDCLGVPPPDVEIKKTVNPSLPLSELELIRQMAEKKPALVPFLYQHLAAVPGQHKVQGSALEAHAQAVAEAVTWQHREEWQRWNKRLPEGEALEIPAQAPVIPEWPRELGFSSMQLDALAGFMAESTQLRFLARVFWRSRLRPGLARLRNWTG